MAHSTQDATQATRRQFLGNTLAAMGAAMLAGATAPATATARPTAGGNMIKPNILWICTDQQRWDTLNCYGNPFVRTPNLDALAAGGTRFDLAFCNSAVCMPSRSSFLTGRYPRVTGCVQNGRDINHKEVLLPRMLRDGAGYRCGYSGKLHITRKDSADGQPPFDTGYEVVRFSPHAWPELPADQYRQWLRQRLIDFAAPPFDGSKYVTESMPAEHSQTRWCADAAIEFIESAASDRPQPWMFSLNWFQPHYPFEPTRRHMQRYLEMLDDIPLPNFDPAELAAKPSIQRRRHEQGVKDVYGSYPYREMTDRDHRLVRAAYWAMIDHIDEEVGRVMDALRRNGQLENTLVLFTSDHGELLGDHGNYLKHPYLYEPSVRVPLIMSMPGTVRAGVVSEALVELVDLAPTLLEIAGVAQSKAYPMQGKSLWPMLTGQAAADHHKDCVYCDSTFFGHGGPTPADGSYFMIRDRRHKLTLSDADSPGELYDLQESPLERRNLWADPAHAQIRQRLSEQLLRFMIASTTAAPAGTRDPMAATRPAP